MLVLKLVEVLIEGYTVILIMKLEDVIRKELNQKLEIKLVLLIDRGVDEGAKCVNGLVIKGVDIRGG